MFGFKSLGQAAPPLLCATILMSAAADAQTVTVVDARLRQPGEDDHVAMVVIRGTSTGCPKMTLAARNRNLDVKPSPSGWWSVEFGSAADICGKAQFMIATC